MVGVDDRREVAVGINDSSLLVDGVLGDQRRVMQEALDLFELV